MADKKCETEHEKRLLGGVAGGEQEAFWELWRTYRDYIYRVCLRQMRGNVADAEDALSEIMLKALRKLPKHAEKIINFKSWLARLARNYCIDIYRRRSRNEACDIGSDEPAGKGISPQATKSEAAHLLVNWGGERLSIRAMTPPLREAFVARFGEAKSYSEIGQLLDISAACARKRVQRALVMIRKQIPPGARTSALQSLALLLDQERARADPRKEQKHPRQVPDAPVRMALITANLSDGSEADFLTETHWPRAARLCAIYSLMRYVQRHPTGWKNRLVLARRLYLLGLWEMAAQEYKRVLQRHPSREVWVEYAEVQRRSRNLSEAHVAYDKALRCPGQTYSDHYIQAFRALSNGRYEDAEDLLQKAIEQQPENARGVYALLNLQYQLEKPVELLETCDRWLARRPDDCVALSLRSMGLKMLQMPDAAYQTARAALEKDPGNPVLLQLLVRHHCERGQTKGSDGREVRAWIGKMLKLFPQAADAHEALAHYYIAQENCEAGVQTLRAFVDNHPRHSGGWLNLATWLSKTGDVDGAAEAILTACAGSNSDIRGYKAAAEILAQADRWGDIAWIVDSLLAWPVPCWTKWTTVAEVLALLPNQEHRGSVLSLYAVGLQPRLPEVWWRYGRVLRSVGNLQEAISAFQRALSLVTSDTGKLFVVQIVLSLADAFEADGDPSATRAWAKKAHAVLDEDPVKSAKYNYLRGLACFYHGDWEAGLQALRKALRERPLFLMTAEVESALRFHQAQRQSANDVLRFPLSDEHLIESL